MIIIKIKVDEARLGDADHFREACDRLRTAFKLDEEYDNTPEPLKLIKRTYDGYIVAGRPIDDEDDEEVCVMAEVRNMPLMPEDQAVAFLVSKFKCNRNQASLILRQEEGSLFYKEWLGDVLLWKGDQYETPEEIAERLAEEERERVESEAKWAALREKRKAEEEQREREEAEARRLKAEADEVERKLKQEESDRLAEQSKQDRIAERQRKNEEAAKERARIQPMVDSELARLRASSDEVMDSLRSMPRCEKVSPERWLAERWGIPQESNESSLR
jgi:hypothetical protein